MKEQLLAMIGGAEGKRRPARKILFCLRSVFRFLARSLPAALLAVVYPLVVVIYSARVVVEEYHPRLFLFALLVFMLCRGGAYALKRAGFKWPVLAYPATILFMVLLLPALRLPTDYPGPAIIPHFTRDHDLTIEEDARLGNRRVKLDYEVRDGMILKVNHGMERRMEVPPESVARFAVGVIAEPGAPPFHLAVFVRSSSTPTPRKVFSTMIERDRTRWEDMSADFSSFAGPGRIVSIQLAATEDDDDQGSVYISRLRFQKKTPESRLNLVLIVIDTLRPDHLNSYGYERRSTDPRLNRLHRERGVKFDFCISPSSWTTPAVASIFTGLYPAEHGVVSFSHMMLREELTVLSELLQNTGYRTAAFSLAYLISPAFNFSRGFDQFYDLSRFMFYWDGDMVAADRAEQWLRANNDQPFFLYFHFMNPHDPYNMGPFFESRSERVMELLLTENAIRSSIFKHLSKHWHPDRSTEEGRAKDHAILRAYDGEIARTDQALDRLISALEQAGVMENTLLVITADHGEEFKEHGSFYHKTTLYQEQIHVPLFVVGPMIKTPGAVIACPVSLVDLTPTLLEAAELEVPAFFSGRSLWPLLDGGVCEPRTIFSDLDNRDSGRELWEAAIADGFKLIRKSRNGETEMMLFDLELNPRETLGLDAHPPPGLKAALVNQLDQLARSREAVLRNLERARLSDEQIRTLRSLGYIQ